MKKGFLLLLLVLSLSIFSQDVSLREKPVDFVKKYFKDIKSRPYGESYTLISENYKKYTGSIREYIKWWDSMNDVKIHDISLVDSDINQLTPKVSVILGYYFENKVYYEDIIFVLGYNTNLDSWQFLDREKVSRF